ncbi:MAG: RidA family protein [Pleurocapsa minor GSE-CHR-MK-17-07R]|jgi:2-iminobutanoate/2-iminopropanoate deaminase|nr:RidA family protein [Pleurocapsa minor GSE-CHR-MK 17-07R]
MAKQIIKTDKAPAALGPYNQGIVAGGFLFTAGQTPLDPATGKLVEGDIGAQTARVFENLRGVIEAAGATFEDVVKSTVYLADMGDFAAMNAVYATYFQVAPARTTIQAARLPLDARVEIEMIVRLPE